MGERAGVAQKIALSPPPPDYGRGRWRKKKMKFKDYYKIMGISTGASADEIKRAYRKLARKYHPDVSKEPDAEERFKELGEAYEALKDPQKRAAYDKLYQGGWKEGEDYTAPPGSGICQRWW